MALTPVPRQALLLALVVVALQLTAAQRFRGAIGHWRPVDPINFDGRVSKRSVRVWPRVIRSFFIEYSRHGSAMRDCVQVHSFNLMCIFSVHL